MTKLTCPHCGNTDQKWFETNGLPKRAPGFSILCMKPCDPDESSFDEYALPDPEDRRVCGMQWEAAEEPAPYGWA